jgi:hypothetical protein
VEVKTTKTGTSFRLRIPYVSPVLSGNETSPALIH